MGHPVKGEEITDDDLDAFVCNVRLVGHFSIAANMAGGRTANAFRYWMDKNPDFGRQVNRSRGKWAAEQLERIKSGEWNLARAYPDELGDRQTIEHEGGVNITLSPHADLMDDEQGGSDE